MRRHLNLIQFSRVLIPLFVVLFHVKAFMNHYFHYDFLSLPDVSKSGGVFYFFVLSGFMAYYLYHTRFGDPTCIKDFLYSRIIRIYPTYWFLTLLILPIYLFLPSLGFGDDRSFGRIFASFMLFPYKSEPLVGVAWSLVHTMFFYLIFVLFFLKNRLYTILAIFLWTVFSIIFGFNLVSIENYFFKYLFNSYNLMFLSGIVCAYMVLKIEINPIIAWFCAIAGIITFPLAWINEQLLWLNLDFEVLTIIASMLILIGFASIDLQKETHLPKVATFLGEASFSIYLVHYYSGVALSIILSRYFASTLPNVLIALILIVISIVSGCFAYILIEKPIHKKLKGYRKKRKESLLMERSRNTIDQITN